MNKIKITLFILFLSLMSTNVLNAQFLKKLSKAVSESVENAAIDQAASTAANKTAEAVDKSVETTSDAVINLFTKKKRKNRKKKNEDSYDDGYDDENENYNEEENNSDSNQISNMLSQSLASMNKEVTVLDIYAFDFMATYTIKSDMGQKSSGMDMTMWFSEAENYTGIYMKGMTDSDANDYSKAMTNNFIITDDDNQALIMIDEKKKTAMIMPSSMGEIMNAAIENMDEEENESPKGKIKKTGKTKKIIGYNCEEYAYEDEDGKASIWISNEVGFYQRGIYDKMLSSMKNGKNKSRIQDLPKGFLMEMHTIYYENPDKDIDGGEMTFIVTELGKKNKMIEMSNYQKNSVFGGMNKK